MGVPEASESAPGEARGARARLGRIVDRVLVAIAALVCLLYASTLVDVGLGGMAIPALPAEAGARDATLRVRVVDEAGAPLPGATVRAFFVDERGKAHFAAEKVAGEDGSAGIEGLPRGETWVLGYGAGRARASARAILGPGEREMTLVLGPAGALEVRVVDEKEAPLPRAEVRLVSEAELLPFVAKVDEEGRARFERLGAGPFAVTGRAPGYDDASRSGVLPNGLPVVLRLRRGGVLEVLVARPDGSPAKGATVLVAGPGLWPPRSTETDASGSARIAGLSAGIYDLKARLGAEASRTAAGIGLAAGEVKEVRLGLEPGRMVRVRVTDGEAAEGREASPVPGASVVLAPDGLSSFPLLGRTDAKGEVFLGPLAPDERAVASARAPGFVPRSAVSVEPPASEVTLALSRAGALVGEVVDDRGYPVAGASIEVVGTDPSGMPIAETTSMIAFREGLFEASLGGPRPLVPVGELGVMPGPLPDIPHGELGLAPPSLALAPPPSAPALGEALTPWVTRGDGSFRAEPVSPGKVQAIVRHPDYVGGVSEVVTLAAGSEAKVRVVLRQGGSIEGRVLEADRRPAAGARVELRAGDRLEPRVTYAQEDGTFSFAAVPGEAVLAVSRREAVADVVARVPVTVPDREKKEVEVVLPELREAVAVTVKDGRGYPLPMAEVRLVSLDPDAPLKRTTFTDDEGEARIPGARGLPLRVEALSPGHAPLLRFVEAAPERLVLELGAGLRAVGRVTGRGGRERLAGASVRLASNAGVRTALSDEEGSFSFSDLAPGLVRVTASHEGFAPREVVLEVRGEPGRDADLGPLDLEAAGEVSGVVVDAEDEPVAGARVAKDFSPTYLPVGLLPPGVAVTDSEGRFTLPGVPEGTWVLEAFSPELGRGAVEGVSVQAGRTTERVTISLEGERRPADPAGAGGVALTLEQRGSAVTVLYVPPSGEAEAAGVFPGDRIVAIDGFPVPTIEQARRRLSGSLSEDVVLELERDGGDLETLFARVKRERVRR